MNLWLLLLLVSARAFAQACPVDDTEAPIKLTTPAGQLVVCGFEDRDVPSVKGRRAFSDFEIFVTGEGKAPVKLFASEESETYWLKEIPAKGVEIEELWIFGDKPQAAFRREITCAAKCELSAVKCAFKKGSNPFPKVLTQFQKRHAEGKLGEDGEEMIDKIFAQAMTGDAAAKGFFSSPPDKLDKILAETFASNKRKLEAGCLF